MKTVSPVPEKNSFLAGSAGKVDRIIKIGDIIR